MSEGEDTARYNTEISELGGDSVCSVNIEMLEVGESGRVNNEMSEGDIIIVTIETMLDQLSDYDPSNHKIAKVPEFLRGGNAEAYDPIIVSIGPIHHDKNHLKGMEQHKVWYLQQLLKRSEHSLEKYKAELGKLEERARNYYSSLITLPTDKDEFVKMLLLDGVFVIELARKWSFSDLMNEKDYIFQYSKGDPSTVGSSAEHKKVHCNEVLIQIRRDMLMIENQLPFFILSTLFEMSKTKHLGDDLQLLVLDFFRRIIPGRPEAVCRSKNHGDNHDHLLGLVYNAYFVDESIDQSRKHEDFAYNEINSTSELREAGIEFRKTEKTTLMNVKFENGVMEIRKLEVGDVTESLFRNLIAYELIRFDDQRKHTGNDKHKHIPRYVTEYCFLMQFLVNTTKDVEILRRAGILINWVGDDEAVRLFFNKLTKNVATSQDFYYSSIIREMNKYCQDHKSGTILKKKYLSSPWGYISVLAATLLLLMTATQTVYSILP